ncbi:hypothetical protein AQUCO_14200012v1 [Aquilegia coerulea]|uniref:EF-hand domain-containing protein n=1 Tax=Aquilegia coerulea TaxID=218851 RepID=A0A2G5C116_AQUCA|nr:hypothetical protein AQUCO_14200012v1 [Aquilegia coerulea]
MSSGGKVFSMENMEEVERIFNRFDSNGDGKISSSELASVLEALGSDSSQEELKRMMSEIDLDGDGFIDLKEFADFHLHSGEETTAHNNNSHKDLKDAFDLYDKDKNGLISAAELHLVFKNLGEKCTVRDCRKMIRSVDVDGDGCVNFEEFKNMMGTNTTKPKSSRY